MNVFEKIVEKLESEHERCINQYGVVGGNLSATEVKRCMEIVNQVAEEYNNGWIACSERLPEESLNSVLGFDEYRERCCFVQYYGGRWILGNDIESVKIIAWQPLPEPFKSEED